MEEKKVARRAVLKRSLAFTVLGGCASSRAQLGEGPRPAVTMERRTVRGQDGAEVQADFGKVTVPAVRSDPSAGAYDLNFVWLRSANAEGRAPIIYLEGGPSSPAAWMAGDDYGMSHIAPLLAASDVILLDQRGTGDSQPSATWRSDLPPNPDVLVSREIALSTIST
jgi:pimeloyl-ACP methyl ester carboxylesterase